MNLINYLVILTILIVVSAVKINYEDYKLYKVTPKDDAAVALLKEMQRQGVGELWSDDIIVGQNVKVMVSPQKNIDFQKIMAGYEYYEVISDVQKVIDNQLKPAISQQRFSQPYLSYSWTEYHNLRRTYNWLDELAQNHPGVVTTTVMGKTLLNNEIKGIIINYNPQKKNPLIGVIEGGLHAREWISTATVTWIIKEFLTSTDPEVRELAENFEWHIFPTVNPDGYNYTFTDNRMWRKNRNPASATTCPSDIGDDMSRGVDLNRNFDFEWMTVGATNDSCSNLYAGVAPFSELETQAIRDYVLKIKEQGQIIYYIAFHSYTQLIIVPYSHVDSDQSLLSGNYADMYEAAIRGADALKRRYGTEYSVGLSANVMYKMSGTSFDWVKRAAKVPMAYLIELRDLGEYGFLLPPDQIIPTGFETMDAILEMDRTTRNLGYYQRSGVKDFGATFSVVFLGVLASSLL